jgi:PTH2 family peptidyl-tRNA hydrolase
VKQVIIMRTDLNMRKGKMIAQGAHASMLFIFDYSIASRNLDILVAEAWYKSGMKKICVGIGSEAELSQLHIDALHAGLRAHIVIDAGHTEFHGVPTMTCLAIGPNEDEAVDKITGGLTLL